MAAKSKSKRQSKDSPDGNELLVLELQEIHSAESQLARALPRLAKAAESDELRQSLEQRLEQGERLIGEIETALEELAESPGRKKNVAAEGLINDLREHVQEIETGPALDAVLIAGIQKTEHYCIAAWGTARSMAESLDQDTAVQAMEQALKEGKEMDEALTSLAEKEIYPQLLSGAAESEEGGEDDDDEESASSSKRSRKGGSSERRQST